jgi:hypothetical protein
MTRRLLATGLLALLLASSPAAASAAAPRPSARSPLVVIVLAPFVSWTDVLEGHTPYLKDIAEDAALGDMNVTSLVPEAGRPSAESGALMLSAGSWTRYDSVSPAACIGNARGGITYTGVLDQIAAQRGTRVLATPGALGQAVRDGGGVTAAIGGSRLLVGGAVEVSPAVLVAMDASGTVDLGTVSPALLRAGGPASDPDAVGGEFSAVLADPRVRRGPALVVVDPGDLQRADASSAPSPRAVEALPRTRALASLDATVREVRGRMPQGATLIVVSQTAARQVSGVTGYGPLLILGPAERGFLTSSSTRRRGVVTSADLSATVLDALGVRAPATFIGAPLSSDGEESSAASRIELLEAKDAMSRAVDAARPFVVDAYIVAVVLVFGFAVVLLALPAVPRRLVVSAQVLMMAVLSVPAASIVMFVPVRYPSSEPLVVALLVAMTLLVWTLAVSSHYNSSLPRGAAFLAAFTAAVVLLDQLTGARLSFSSLFGYSPVVGARYYGIGNESAALLVGGALTGLTILLDHSASQHWVSAARRYGLPAVAFVCVLTAAAPFLGSVVHRFALHTPSAKSPLICAGGTDDAPCSTMRAPMRRQMALAASAR